jgi:CRP-like cAMP-binding protein
MRFLELFRNWEDVQEHNAGTVIFTERDPADVMYVILSGEIELTLHGETLGAESKGGIIGEMAKIDSAAYGATATTRSNVKLARLDRGQFEDFIGKNSEFALHVMEVMANRLRAVDKYITTQIAPTVSR